MDSDIRRRYWSLVVTACEWRAYGVEAPEVMAAWVFASLDHGKAADPGKVADLRVLFGAVDKVVAQAYRDSASRRSSLDAIRGLTMVPRRDAALPAALTALSSLREGDRRILQHAHWDDLDPLEIANVLGTEIGVVHRRLDDATRRFTTRLVRRGVPVDDVGALLTQIKPGTHHRRG